MRIVRLLDAIPQVGVRPGWHAICSTSRNGALRGGDHPPGGGSSHGWQTSDETRIEITVQEGTVVAEQGLQHTIRGDDGADHDADLVAR